MSTFEVDQVANNDRHGDGIHQVQVTLAKVQYRQLVGDITRRLRSLGYLPPVTHGGQTLEEQVQLDYWMPLMPPTPSWLLEPEEAAAFSTALLEACEEPASCAGCGLFVERPSSLDQLCASCDEKATRRSGPRG